jgi:site-specific DNA-methyltransferase (cytosine-N4-specific)
VPEFFIKMLTDPGDLVVDIFAGSNTTGCVAERLSRKWVSVDNNLEYLRGSIFRFLDGDDAVEIRAILSLLQDEKANFELSRSFSVPTLFEEEPLPVADY